MMATEYLTVTALTSYIKRKFDVDPYLQRIYLVGEISNFRPRPNSHQYFSLKDDHAKINAIMFKSAFSKVKFRPEEGMKVLVTGRISVYPGNGGYQIYIDSMQPDGVGALYQAYEQLKQKLSAEGLFTAPKQDLVKFPKRIAVVTSPSGAVIRDIITTVQRRYPIAQIVLYPAVVQGNDAAGDIVRQIERVNQDGTFDTLIIGRGGGSIEDLWPFNEETVARAIFDSAIPVISSVGHETDTTIADLVADVRAATPTAAAELATPVLSDELLSIQKQQLRLNVAVKNRIDRNRQLVQHLTQSYVFTDPSRLYEGYIQNIDQLKLRLTGAQRGILNNFEQRLISTNNQLKTNTPKNRIELLKQTVSHSKESLFRNMQQNLMNDESMVRDLITGLDHLSPLKVMGRGFTYVTKNDHVIKSTADLSEQEAVSMHFKDGTAEAVVQNIEKDNKDGK
ncbi:exodeoxyribonuclease VII large subunit [Pediococcus argentinicus]|uniref:exodeoxyribonuclease VII large subunit n=1 Tax=Pediococcus argentinicus TaxID=480391 RepID=UPI00338F8F64